MGTLSKLVYFQLDTSLNSWKVRQKVQFLSCYHDGHFQMGRVGAEVDVEDSLIELEPNTVNGVRVN